MKGSAGTLDALLLPVLDAAYATALRLTRNPADAEDLVQEAAFLATRGFGQFQRDTNFKAWFLRILTNAFLSGYRKHKREGTRVDLEDTPELFLYEQTAGAGLHSRFQDPGERLLDRLDREAVAEAIDALPEEYRVTAALYFTQDLSYQEIADMTGVPVGTVRSRLHRGRRLLQQSLWSIAQDRGIIASLGMEDERHG